MDLKTCWPYIAAYIIGVIYAYFIPQATWFMCESKPYYNFDYWQWNFVRALDFGVFGIIAKNMLNDLAGKPSFNDTTLFCVNLAIYWIIVFLGYRPTISYAILTKIFRINPDKHPDSPHSLIKHWFGMQLIKLGQVTKTGIINLYHKIKKH